MRSMAHRFYNYTPARLWVRKKMSDSHLQRLGNPPGAVRVYGVHVPFQHALPLRELAAEMARVRGYEAAHEFVSGIAKDHWVDMPQVWRLYRARRDVIENRRIIARLKEEASAH